MDSPERTAAYQAELARRKAELAEVLPRLIPRDRPFVWEVGCGHGHFLTAYAQAHPEAYCLGVDLVAERVERANRKRDRAGLANLAFLRSEARLFLEQLPAGLSLHRIFILFPDPWPKARHHKHRILDPDFLSAVAERAAAEARLHFRTDYQPYFTDAAATVAAHRDWQPSGEAWPFEFETVFQARAESFGSLTARRRARAH